MACNVFAKTDGKESTLYKELEKIIGEKDALIEHSKISGDNFVKMFGDFELSHAQQYSGDINLDNDAKVAPRTYDNGEPRLFRKTVVKGDKVTEYNQYYFKFPNGIRRYINKIKFPGMTSDQSEAVSKMLLNAFVSENMSSNFEDLSKLSPEKLMTSIENSMANYKNSTTDPERLRRANLVLQYKEDFKIEVINKIEELGLSYRQSIINEKGELESELGEDDKIGGGINIAESFETNSKETAPARIKLLLSLIPDTMPNKKYAVAIERLKARHGVSLAQIQDMRLRLNKGEVIDGLSTEDIADLKTPQIVHKPDSYLGRPKFAEFDDVWSTLQPLLSDIVFYNSSGGDLMNVFELMQIEMNKIRTVKPWMGQLLSRLKNMDSNQQAQFVQTFSKAKLNFYVTEYDNETKKYKIINATSTNSRESRIRGAWSNDFFKNFTKNREITIDGKAKLESIRNKITKSRADYATYERQSREVQNAATRDHVTILFNAINELGSDLKMNDFVSYIRLTGGEDKAMNGLLDLHASADYLLKYLLNPTTSLKAGDENVNPFDNQDGIKLLSKAKAMFEVDMAENNVLANNGKSYFTYSNPSYLHNVVNEWKRDKTELLNLASNIYHANSRWIKYLTNTEVNRNGRLIATNAASREKTSESRINALTIGLDSSFKSKGENDGKDTKEISPIDALNNAISKVLGHKTGGKSYAQTLLAADKGRKIEIEGMPTFDSAIDYSDGKWYINDETLDVMADYFNDEYSRMKQVSNEINTLPKEQHKIYYHSNKGGANGLKSQVFPSLSHENMDKDSLEYISLYKDGLPLGQENGIHAITGMTAEQRKVVKDVIRASLEKKLEENAKNMSDTGIVHIGETNSSISVNEDVMKAYEGFKDPVRAMSGDYFINSVINAIEYNKLFLGDPAYFKNMSDMIKRTPASYTDGLQLFLAEKDHIHFNQATVAGVEVSSKYVELIRESVKDKSIADAYDNNGVNSTDAQAWITPKRWKFLKERLGQWSTGKDSHQSAWEKMNPSDGVNFETLSQKEMKLVAQPLKGVYFELNAGAPVYLKYSQAVLIPQLVKLTPMQALLDKMTKDKDGNILSGKDEIHEVVTVDGVKVGATSPTEIHEMNGTLKAEFTLNPIPLKNRGWKLQQDLPTKLAHDTMVGSQIQKNILAGIDLEGTYEFNGESVLGTEMLSNIHKTLSQMSDMGKESIMEEFGINIDPETGKMTITNMDRVYMSLISEFKSRGGSDNIISALEKDMPFDAIPQIRNKVENIFMSMMNKKLTKIYTNGGSFIQVSPFGFESITEKKKSGIKIVSDNYDSKGLKPPHYDKKTGKYMPGQCFMPHSALLKLLPQGTDWAGMSGAELMKLIDPSALQLVTYRIPNQGMSSNDAMEIVGILPPGVGDAIIAYDAVPAKTGSDFDIDKMYVMMPNLVMNKKTGKIEAIKHNENSKKSKEVQNRLIDLYASVLNSESAYDKVMTSIDASFFKDDIIKMFPETKLDDLLFYSPAYQMKTKFEYLSGKMGVAQTANQLVDHMLNKHQNIRYNGFLGTGHREGNGFTKFDNEYDTDGKHLIADSISAFLNAYVDIAKDPYISRGNHNGVTSSVTFMMIRAGAPIGFVNRLIAQPVLANMVTVTKNSEGITSEQLMFEGERVTATEFVKRSNGFGTFEAGPSDVAYLESLGNAKLEAIIKKYAETGSYDSLTEEEREIQTTVINVFEYLQSEAKYFSESISASKTPDAGDFAQVMVAKNKYNKVIADAKILGFEEKFEDTFSGKYKKNGIDWVEQLAVDNDLFISSNQTLQNTINDVSKRIGKGDVSTNEEFIKSISSDFYSYAMSGLSIFKKNREDFKTLFTDTPLDVAALKATGTKNFLIQELEIKTSSGVNFLKINSKNKPKTYNNKIYRSWVQLLKSDIKEERVLGTRLIRYAYSQSGFKTNLNQFFTHIPHEALTSAGISEHIKTVQSDMKSLDLNAEFRSQMFRHNAKDKKIVPRISTKNIKRVGSHSSYFGFTYNPASESKNTIATGKNEQGFETFPEFISMKAASEGKESEKDVMLFKLVGLSKQEVSKNSMEDYTQVAEKEYKFMPTYARTYKLGAKYNNGSVVEYQYDESVNSSIIFENNLNTKQEEMLDAFMAEANAKGLFFRPDMMIPKTETLLSENKEVSLSESNEDEDWQTEENDCPMPIK